MNSRQLMQLREGKEFVHQLREALDDLPPMALISLARAYEHEGRSLEELYEFLDGIGEAIDKMLVNAARKKAP